MDPPVVRYTSAGGVVIHAGRMLLLDRPSRGEVRLPKGHVELGEDVRAAALRETREETGYADLEVAADLGRAEVVFDYKGERIVRDEHYFLMRLASDRRVRRPPKDAAQFEVMWAPLSEAEARLTFAAERTAARRAVARHREDANRV